MTWSISAGDISNEDEAAMRSSSEPCRKSFTLSPSARSYMTAWPNYGTILTNGWNTTIPSDRTAGSIALAKHQWKLLTNLLSWRDNLCICKILDFNVNLNKLN